MVAMWSRCGGVIGAMRHASAMHPIVMFRIRTRCERWRMLSGMRHTGRIRETYGTIATSKKRIVQINPPPLMMGGGGDSNDQTVRRSARLGGGRSLHFLSLHGVGLTIAEDENLTITKDFFSLFLGTLYLVYGFCFCYRANVCKLRPYFCRLV